MVPPNQGELPPHNTQIHSHHNICSRADLEAMAANVEFYEKLRDLQATQHRSESERLDLQRQLHSHLGSDHRCACVCVRGGVCVRVWTWVCGRV